MIRFENIPDTEHGADFKAECKIILRKAFPKKRTAEFTTRNIVAIIEKIKSELKKRGYIYNRASLHFLPNALELQGYIGGEKSVDKWSSETPMTCRFSLPYDAEEGLVAEFSQ